MKHLYNRVDLQFWKKKQNHLQQTEKNCLIFAAFLVKQMQVELSVSLCRKIFEVVGGSQKLNLIQLCQLSNQHYFKHKYNYISGWQWTFKNRNNITIFLFEPNKIFNTNFSNYCTILWFGPINKHIDRFPHHSLAPAINCKNDHFDAV